MQMLQAFWVFTYFFTLINLYYAFALNEECSTPYRKKGVCVDIVDCPQIYDRLQAKDFNLTDKEKQYIRESRCDLQDNPKIICCPLVNDAPFIQFPRTEKEKEFLPVAPNCGMASHNQENSNRVTTIYEYPWIALIEYTNANGEKVHFCSGSLINKRFVLTAAHCVKKLSADWTLTGVRLGEWDTTKNPDCVPACADPYQEYKVEKIFTHPNASSREADGHDIALLFLSADVSFTDFVKPICLPVVRKQQTNDYLDRPLETAGWSEPNGPSNQKLKSVAQVWSLESCQNAYVANNLVLNDNQICAGNTKDSSDSCNGDSGGPLMAVESYSSMKAYVAAGVMSFGPVSCGAQGFPNVYTKVGPYMEWIKSIILN